MKIPVYQIDAFTNHIFAGNPATVRANVRTVGCFVSQAMEPGKGYIFR